MTLFISIYECHFHLTLPRLFEGGCITFLPLIQAKGSRQKAKSTLVFNVFVFLALSSLPLSSAALLNLFCFYRFPPHLQCRASQYKASQHLIFCSSKSDVPPFFSLTSYSPQETAATSVAASVMEMDKPLLQFDNNGRAEKKTVGTKNKSGGSVSAPFL